MNLNGANLTATHVTLTFNVRICTRAAGPRRILVSKVGGMSERRLFISYSVVDLRYPLATAAQFVMGGRALSLVGANTVLVGAKEKPLISRASITRTLRGKRLNTCNTSMLSVRPPSTSGPLLSTPRTCVAPRVT